MPRDDQGKNHACPVKSGSASTSSTERPRRRPRHRGSRAVLRVPSSYLLLCRRTSDGNLGRQLARPTAGSSAICRPSTIKLGRHCEQSYRWAIEKFSLLGPRRRLFSQPIGPEDGVLLADRFRRLWQIRPRAAAAGLAGEKSTVAAALEVEEGFCEEFQQPCRHFSAGKGRLRRRIPSTADAAARGWHCGAGRNDDCPPRLPALQARWRRQTAFRHGLRKARRPSRTWSYVSWRLPLREICSLQVWGDGAKPKSMVDGGISTTVESRQAPAANLWRSRIAVLRRSERHIPHKGRGAAPSPCSRASVPSSP